LQGLFDHGHDAISVFSSHPHDYTGVSGELGAVVWTDDKTHCSSEHCRGRIFKSAFPRRLDSGVKLLRWVPHLNTAVMREHNELPVGDWHQSEGKPAETSEHEGVALLAASLASDSSLKVSHGSVD
jgi:hypothetical protein